MAITSTHLEAGLEARAVLVMVVDPHRLRASCYPVACHETASLGVGINTDLTLTRVTYPCTSMVLVAVTDAPTGKMTRVVWNRTVGVVVREIHAALSVPSATVGAQVGNVVVTSGVDEHVAQV